MRVSQIDGALPRQPVLSGGPLCAHCVCQVRGQDPELPGGPAGAVSVQGQVLDRVPQAGVAVVQVQGLEQDRLGLVRGTPQQRAEFQMGKLRNRWGPRRSTRNHVFDQFVEQSVINDGAHGGGIVVGQGNNGTQLVSLGLFLLRHSSQQQRCCLQASLLLHISRLDATTDTFRSGPGAISAAATDEVDNV